MTDVRLQIIPSSSSGPEGANFRSMKESTSLHLEEETIGMASTRRMYEGMQADGTDLFGGFSNVTLHYDGES